MQQALGLAVPVREHLVGPQFSLPVKELAQIASDEVSTHVDPVVPLPLEVLLVHARMIHEPIQILGQIFRRVEVESVYVRLWWREDTVIGATVNDWYYVVPGSKWRNDFSIIARVSWYMGYSAEMIVVSL